MNERPLSLSVFFPTYNEAANIEQSVQEAIASVEKITPLYEILIIDDGSKDDTPAIARRLATAYRNVRVISHEQNQGYGAAVWTGIQAAQYDYVFYTDADLQFDLDELSMLTTHAPEHKIVIGYRAKRNDPFIRLFNAKLWNIVNRVLFGLKVRDIDCAFKLLDRELVAALPVSSRGAMMSAEMLIRLNQQNVAIKEVPVTHYSRTEGVATGAKPSVIIRAIKELVLLYKGELGRVPRQQLLRFAGVGVINTAIDIGIYFLLTRTLSFFAAHLLVSKALSFGAGTVFSFFVNRYWTFNTKTAIHYHELIRFYLTVGIGMAINVVSLSIAISLLSVPDSVAVVIATITAFAWNFTASKLWVYSQASRGTL